MNARILIAFINHQDKRHIKQSNKTDRMDWCLLTSVLLLSCCGLLNLYSANPALCFKQSIYTLVGLILMLCIRNIATETLYRWTPYCYLAASSLLLLVLGLGYISKGAQRWLHIGFFNLQPSELTKIALPMMLSWMLHKTPLPPRLDHTAKLGLLMLLPALLVYMQPDLGTAIILIAVGIGILILGGLPWRHFAMGTFTAILSLPLLWHNMHDYQKNRVMTFLNPESDPLGKGYHIIQSKIAIGSGGFFGKGWLQGTQAHLQFLPEHSTDFVFALWGEEFGFLGGVLLLVLFAFITHRLFRISQQAPSTFSRILSGSFALLFALSCAINLGMVMGLLPVVGVPLPFMSYGGSHLLTWFAALGIALGIYRDKKLIAR